MSYAANPAYPAAGPVVDPSAAGAAAGLAVEQVLWEGVPSMRALAVEGVGAALYAVALPIGVLLLFDPALSAVSGLGPAASDLVRANRPALALGVTLVVGAIVLARAAKLAWHALVLRSNRYRVSNQRIVVERGALAKRIDEVDMRTVEDVDFEQTFLERLLGIGRIAIVSSDRQLGRFRLLGVKTPRDVRERIRSCAYQATRAQVFTRRT